MPDDQSGNGQIPVSPNNPCPFLRALVANGYVAGHIVPLPKIATTIEKASGETGANQTKVWLETYGVALIANGLNPLRQLQSAMTGAVLDELRNGPLDKHGAGSRILGVDAHVHEGEIDRLATFGKDRPDGAGGVERGLNAKEIAIYMAANIKRAEDSEFGPMVLPDPDEGRMAGPAQHHGQAKATSAISAWPRSGRCSSNGVSPTGSSRACPRRRVVDDHLNSGVPGTKASKRRPELRAVAILLLQDLVLWSPHHQNEPARKRQRPPRSPRSRQSCRCWAASIRIGWRISDG